MDNMSYNDIHTDVVKEAIKDAYEVFTERFELNYSLTEIEEFDFGNHAICVHFTDGSKNWEKWLTRIDVFNMVSWLHQEVETLHDSYVWAQECNRAGMRSRMVVHNQSMLVLTKLIMTMPEE